jgi:polysaccharide biosynthesis protein VpsM
MNNIRHRLLIPATVWSILGLVALLGSGRSSRATPLDDWPIKFHPHLDLQASYDDNVLISSTNQQADFSFLISPGLQLEYGSLDHNYLSLDYTMGIERFYRLTNLDAINNDVAFKSVFNFSRVKLQIDHTFKDDTSEDFEAGTRIEQQQNLTSASAEYSLNQYFSIGALYHQELDHFPTPGQNDSQLYEPGVAIYYHVSPKTDVFGEFDYGWADVSQGENQQFETVNLGLRGKITSKITGNIGLGYEHRDFSGTTPSIDTVVTTVSLHGDFTKHTFADLTIGRQINPSSTTNASTSVTVTRADFQINQKIYREKFLVYVGGAYEHDEYSGISRIDNIWEGRVGARYIATKWLEFGASYRYQHNASSASFVSFEQDLASVDALVHF